MRNGSVQETSIVGEALRSIATLLPASWKVDDRAEIRSDGIQVDAAVELTAATGERASFAIEAKRSGSVPTTHLLSALRELERRHSLPVLFMSDYIGPSLRACLAAAGISFADATGWVRVASEDPLVLLTGQGAKRSPRSGRTSAIVRLNGVAASRVIRMLTTTAGYQPEFANLPN